MEKPGEKRRLSIQGYLLSGKIQTCQFRHNLELLRDYAHRNNYQIFKEFVDEAESGRTADRPAFREMISLARTKHPPFGAVLVWKLNRFC